MNEGRAIKILRAVRGMEQGELAKLAEVEQATVSNIERGHVQARGTTGQKRSGIDGSARWPADCRRTDKLVQGAEE